MLVHGKVNQVFKNGSFAGDNHFHGIGIIKGCQQMLQCLVLVL